MPTETAGEQTLHDCCMHFILFYFYSLKHLSYPVPWIPTYLMLPFSAW